jgi:predicted nucleotidyltransferase
MRLSKEQVNTIVSTCRLLAGEGSRVMLYGSRLDDSRHGGDIDVLLEPVSPISLLQRARIKWRLEEALRLPVDLSVRNPDREASAFIAMIRPRAQQLELRP